MNGRRLIVAGVEVPLLNDVQLPITYAIEDIRNPESTNANMAGTIELPSTKELDELFEFCFDPSVSLQSFNPNLETSVEYWIGENRIFEGNIKLVKTISYLAEGRHSYIVDFIGQKLTLFYNIGDKFITGNDNPLDDIDMSAYDHVLNSTNVTGSWLSPTHASAGTGYRYALIDYGYSGSGANGGTNTIFAINHLRPLVFVREVLSKIFADSGKKWTSTFLDSAFFKKILISSNEQIKLPVADITNRLVYTNFSTPLTQAQSLTFNAGTNLFENSNTLTQVSIYDDDSTLPYSDPSGQYNIASGEITVANTGYYDFTASLNVGFKVNYNNVTATQLNVKTCDYFFKIKIQKWNGSVWVDLNFMTDSQLGYTGGNVFPNTAGVSTIFADNQYTVNYNGLLTSGDIVRVLVEYKLDNCEVWTGNTAQVTVNPTPAFTYEFLINTTTTTETSTFIMSPVADINEGDTVEVNQCLPKQLKQRDFLKGIIQAFNLYIYEDVNDSSNYFIEPRDTFYSTTYQNWTDKLDLSKPVETLVMGELDAKKYVFDMKADSDYYNKLYLDNWKYNSGHKEFNVESKFLKNENKIELPFSPTPMVNNYDNGLIITHIYKRESSTISVQTSNTRLLMWGGLVSMSYGSWTFKTVSANTAKYTYPYAGTLDHPYAPTFDLNFGIPKEIYIKTQPGYIWPASNLFTEYWDSFLNQISNKNSRLVRAYFNLTEIDIKSLDFRNPIVLNDNIYLLNKIEDFDLLEAKTTLVELLKIN